MINFKEIVAEKLNSLDLGFSVAELTAILESPPDRHLGDFAFPCYKLAKIFRKSPNLIAGELRNQIQTDQWIAKVENVGPYLNFFVNETTMAMALNEEIREKGPSYGSSRMGKGINVVVEFSSTNIAKPFHIGHIRSTVIGNAIHNIYRFLGYHTTSINYLGDYGTQFGIMIAAYRKWGDKEQIQGDPINQLLKLYVDYNYEASLDPELMDEARYWFEQLEKKNPEALELWSWFKEISLNEFDRVYQLLDISFDSYKGEAYYSQFMPEVIEQLRNQGLLQVSEGAQIVDLSEYKLPPVLIIKSNGSSTYLTRDLATAITRKKQQQFQENIYVVGSQQLLHFQQMKAVLKLMGYDWYEQCIHVPFGMVSMREGTMSTRKGKVIFLEDVLNKAVEKTLGIIHVRNPELDNKEQVAKDVGIGAVIFQELFNNRIKDYVFDWDSLLNFEGETGPYTQYSHARACSLIRKGNFSPYTEVNMGLLTSSDESSLIKLLYGFPEIIKEAKYKLEPSLITRHLVDIAKIFNKFYNSCPILSSPPELRNARLMLTHDVKVVLAVGLKLLGIKAPEKM